MSKRKVKPDGLAGAIAQMMQEYTDDVRKGLSLLTDEVSKECVQELKRSSPAHPERTGKYRRGWKRSKTPRGWVVHNTEYQRTHLLEYGHWDKQHGINVAGKAHIRPAADAAADKVMKGLREVVQG